MMLRSARDFVRELLVRFYRGLPEDFAFVNTKTNEKRYPYGSHHVLVIKKLQSIAQQTSAFFLVHDLWKSKC